MKKLITLFFVLFCYAGFGQVYQLMPQYGYQANRFRFDSTLQIPTVCGVPTLKSNVTKLGAIAFDSCNNRFYTYNPKTATWSEVSGGGGSTDTTSLSARIDARVKYTDTASMLAPYFRRSLSANDTINTNGRVLQMNAIGSGLRASTFTFDTLNPILSNTIPSGSVGTLSIFGLNNIMSSTLSGASSTQFRTASTAASMQYSDLSVTPNVTNSISVASSGISFLRTNIGYTFPTARGTTGQILKLTSPSQIAWANDETGSVDTTSLSNRINLKMDSVKRRSDSVFAYRNGTEIYQFKDSVGTNPPPVGYYGSFQDNTTQTAASANTATAVKFNTTDLSNGVTIVNDGSSNPTRVTIANAGVYNIQFSLQLEKISGSGNYVIDIWLRKNGTNVEGTTGKVVLTGSANASPVVAAWNYVLQLASNDYVELMWSTSNTNAVIISESASTPYPSVPSSILTITQQSGIMAGTGVSPLDTANMLSPYQRKQLPAYSFIANGTNAAANGTATYFEDTSGTYTGSITWTAGTQPGGATNHSYRWTRIGKMVNLTISLVYATNALTATQIVVALPSDAPAPFKPAGLTSASNGLYAANAQFQQNATAAPLGNTPRAILRNNSGNNGFEIVVFFSSSTILHTFIHVQYTAE